MSELNEKLATAWEGFTKGDWQNEVNVRDFIQKNYTPYEGDESFLAGATEATTTLWDKVMEGVKLENRTHAPVDFDTAVASTITSHDAGYINKALEKVVEVRTHQVIVLILQRRGVDGHFSGEFLEVQRQFFRPPGHETAYGSLPAYSGIR